MLPLLSLAVIALTAAAPPPDAPTPAAPPADAPPPAAAPAEPKRALRLAVYDLKADGIDPRTVRIVNEAVVAELRKLQHTSVVSMDEVKAMLDLEAQKELVGCSDESCLSEIADSLGVDGLVIGNVARLEGDTIIGLKRLDQRKGGVVGTASKRLKTVDGSELLAAVGPLVAEAFPDIPLRPGTRRGVDPAIVLRLNPPPVPAWAYWSDAVATGAVAVAGASAVVLNRLAVADHDAFVAATLETQTPVRGVDVRAKQDTIAGTAVASWILLGTAALGGASLGALIPFTDFDDLKDAGAGGAE